MSEEDVWVRMRYVPVPFNMEPFTLEHIPQNRYTHTYTYTPMHTYKAMGCGVHSCTDPGWIANLVIFNF